MANQAAVPRVVTAPLPVATPPLGLGIGGPQPPPTPWVRENGYISYPHGVVVGAPPGGDMGNGTINARGLFIDGTEFTPEHLNLDAGLFPPHSPPGAVMRILRSVVDDERPQPGTRHPGELYVNIPDRCIGIIDQNGDPIDLNERAFVSDQPPHNPNEGELWFDSVGQQLYVWYTDPTSSQWVATNSGGGGQGGGLPGGGANVEVGPTPPAAPNEGDLWFDSVGEQLFIWANSQWLISVPAVPGPMGPQGPAGLDGAVGPPGPQGPPGADAGAPSNSPPSMNGSISPGTSSELSRADHVHPTDTSRLSVAGGFTTGPMGYGGTATGTVLRLGPQGPEMALFTASIQRSTLHFNIANNTTVFQHAPAGASYIMDNTGAGNVSGDLIVGGTVTEISDERIKRNVAPADEGIEVVRDLHPKRFIREWGERAAPPEKVELGFIAQEVEPVLPEAVAEAPLDGQLGVRMTALIAVLVNAVKQLDARLAALEGVR